MNLETVRGSISKSQVEQLHQLVLQLSKNCFEIKKLCCVTLISACVLISSFTDQRLDYSLFAGAGIILLFFYLLDVQSYFYQRKARLRMKELAEELLRESGEDRTIQGFGLPIKTHRSKASGLLRAFFNASMMYYAFLAMLNMVLILLWMCRVIK